MRQLTYVGGSTIEWWDVPEPGLLDDRNALPMPFASARNAPVLADVVMTPAQRRVADIWQEVLHMDRVGLHDNFFDIGGHSLLLIKVHAALKTEFPVGS